MRFAAWGFVLPLLVGCPSSSSVESDAAPDAGASSATGLGAHWIDGDRAVSFRIASEHATRIELWIYDAPTGTTERLRVPMDRTSDVWHVEVAAAELPSTIYYGYRVWGPNWPYDAAWTPGSEVGWIADVDRDGNRMNPNKLVFDPYARELSHDPTTPAHADGGVYATGGKRAIDSAPYSPKGIVVRDELADRTERPTRAFADEVIYEVHLRGFTNAADIPCAGTYAGAAAKAAYLAELGVTAIELLPIQETPNDRNDVDPASTSGDNYWGYSTLAYFAPDRRYACDRSPGGPTREVRDMVRAFHAHGIKVYIDVVYNHTSEGSGGSLLSMRGIDNAGYYQLDRDGDGFYNSNGVGADVATNRPLAAQLVLDSLAYWRDVIGVDGYRFDLAPILGNTCNAACFTFDPDALPAQIARDFARPTDGGDGVDLIAEPWALVQGSYQVGGFGTGWSEWNDRYRDLVRSTQNQQGVTAVTPGWLAARIHGSSELYREGGRPPAASVNFVVAHDGFTLHDLYACNGKNNGQAWPYGPSDGGSNDNKSWDHGGSATAQRQAARTGLALLLLSQGVPMITGGDERLRSQRCNNNPYNLDSPVTWLDWSPDEPAFTTFTRRMLAFRAAHPALRSRAWIEPAQIAWRDATGSVMTGAAMDDASLPVIAWQLDGAALGDSSPAIYVAYNRSPNQVAVTLAAPPSGLAWYRVADTGAWMEAQANIAAPGGEYKMNQSRYDLVGRSLALFVAR
jgi:isoamylase